MKCLLFVRPENLKSYFGFGCNKNNRNGGWIGNNLYYIYFDGTYMKQGYSKFKLRRIKKWQGV